MSEIREIWSGRLAPSVQAALTRVQRAIPTSTTRICHTCGKRFETLDRGEKHCSQHALAREADPDGAAMSLGEVETNQLGSAQRKR